jgi:DNA-binding phage protein
MRTTPFDAADYLGTREAQVEYIAAAFETGDPEFIRDARGLVARARAKSMRLRRRNLLKRPRQTDRGDQ